ncbi:MAG: hypothetical protein PVF49_12865, partial [Anaerolineales bacterium]
KQFEDTIKGAAIDARRAADQTISQAKKEAAEALTKAKAEAQKMVAGHREQMTVLEKQVALLKKAKESYMGKLRELIGGHLKLIEEVSKDQTAERLAEAAVKEAAAEGEAQAASIAQTFETPKQSPKPEAQPQAPKVQMPKETSKPLVNGLEITESAEVEARQRETIATPPSKPVGIRTEEANAASDIVPADVPDETDFSQQAVDSDEPATPEPSPAQPEESVPQPDEPAQAEIEEQPAKNIDPELAAALESYQKGVEEEGGTPPATPQAAGPNQVMETTARAEDIPPEFVAATAPPPQRDADMRTVADGDYSEENEEEKAASGPQMAPEAQDQPTEHNTIDIDGTGGHQLPRQEAEEEAVDPENLAEELDKVVAKFEEEMDRAARS